MGAGALRYIQSFDSVDSCTFLLIANLMYYYTSLIFVVSTMFQVGSDNLPYLMETNYEHSIQFYTGM